MNIERRTPACHCKARAGRSNVQHRMKNKRDRGRRTEDRGRLATDPHRLTQTFVRRTRPPRLSESDGGQASPDKNSHRFARKSQKS